MALADLPVLAALLMAVAALPAGWRGGRALGWAMAGSVLLAATNILLAWQAGDPPGTTMDGQAAAFGIMLAIALLLLALAFAGAGRIIRWSMTSRTAGPRESGRPKETTA